MVRSAIVLELLSKISASSHHCASDNGGLVRMREYGTVRRVGIYFNSEITIAYRLTQRKVSLFRSLGTAKRTYWKMGVDNKNFYFKFRMFAVSTSVHCRRPSPAI